jgi:hypothetical protein
MKKVRFKENQTKLFSVFIQGADMMSDLLSTCYSDYISISRPQSLIPSLNNSSEDEREPSPVHLSSAMSTSSRVSCFSQRLVQLDKNKINSTMGRGRGIETNLSQIDRSFIKEREDNFIDTTLLTPSIHNSSKFYFITQY